MKRESSITVLLGTLFGLALLGMGLATMLMEPGLMNAYIPLRDTTASGWGWVAAMALGSVAMVAIWGVMIGGAVVFVRWLMETVAPTTNSSGGAPPPATRHPGPASGEIDDESYERVGGKVAA